jgi:5-methylcytosine-specific restriction endonuclease McrA
MNSRVRCANCKSYFDRADAVWQNSLQRICSSACLSEHMDRKAPGRRQVAAARADRKAQRRTSLPVAVRLNVRARDLQRCRWCERPGQQVHHVHYRSEGGQDEESNLVLLCQACHNLVHSNKRVYKPVLLAYLWIHYTEAQTLPMRAVIDRLDRSELLSETQRSTLLDVPESDLSPSEPIPIT